jgi:predicted nucleic acid-binding protein
MIVPAFPEDLLVLDSDVLSDWRKSKSYTRRKIDEYVIRFGSLPALTSITVYEALYGFEKKVAASGSYSPLDRQGLQALHDLINDCDVLPFDGDAASIAAQILPRVNNNKMWKDVFIAATALSHGRGVATRNRGDYELIAKRVPAGYEPLRLAF